MSVHFGCGNILLLSYALGHRSLVDSNFDRVSRGVTRDLPIVSSLTALGYECQDPTEAPERNSAVNKRVNVAHEHDLTGQL